MPIETILAGETARNVCNKVGISRIGFDGLSCYLFLKDGSAIKIDCAHNYINNESVLQFYRVVFLPNDQRPL